MKHKTLKMTVLIILALILITWTISTYYVENVGYDVELSFIADQEKGTSLIVFDPDPIYDFDKKVCTAIAEGFNTVNWSSKIVSANKMQGKDLASYDIIILCANTYNFAPDRIMKKFIKTRMDLSGKNVGAVTLGAGSTQKSQKILEELITQTGARLLITESYWLLRPNDESMEDMSNEEIAFSKARMIAKTITAEVETNHHTN